MLTLFHAPWSRSSRIIWLLEELGADFDINYCTIRRIDGSGEPDPKNPHPDGKVPALIHDGALVTESAAVALYLTDLFPKAGIGAPVGSRDRAAYVTWLTWGAGEMEPALWGKIEGRTDAYSVARNDAVIDRLQEALWAGPYLMGDRFTAVDVMIGSSLGWGREYLPDTPVFDRYLERLDERPAHVRAQAKDEKVAEAA
jgi:glutathione S-transferase